MVMVPEVCGSSKLLPALVDIEDTGRTARITWPSNLIEGFIGVMGASASITFALNGTLSAASSALPCVYWVASTGSSGLRIVPQLETLLSCTEYGVPFWLPNG